MNEKINETKVIMINTCTNYRYINCSNCHNPFPKELWCKRCDPYNMIKGWTSGNPSIDKFIKDTIYNTGVDGIFLRWVPFEKFKNMKKIGEGGFSKVYAATWMKSDRESMTVALKRLIGSQNMSEKYLNEV